MNFVLCYVCINIHRLHSDDRSHIIEDILLAQILHSQFNNAKRDVRSKNLTTFGGRERERKSESGGCKRDRLPTFLYMEGLLEERSFVM